MSEHDELIQNIEETPQENPEIGGEKKKTRNVRTAKKAKRTSFSTWEGHALSPQEAKFIDEYCITGNGRQSYITAYPSSNPNNAHQNAYRLLSKDYINSEINHRLEEARDDSIADAAEIMSYFTNVMRGEIKDQFGLEAPLAERTKAAVELAKRQIDIPQKMSGNEQPEIKITLDWARPSEAERPKTVREILGDGLTQEEIASYEGRKEDE